MDVSEWFPVNVGLTNGWVTLKWLFNVYMDGAVLGKVLELMCKAWSV